MDIFIFRLIRSIITRKSSVIETLRNNSSNHAISLMRKKILTFCFSFTCQTALVIEDKLQRVLWVDVIHSKVLQNVLGLLGIEGSFMFEATFQYPSAAVSQIVAANVNLPTRVAAHADAIIVIFANLRGRQQHKLAQLLLTQKMKPYSG